jgi:hypothetical protein
MLHAHSTQTSKKDLEIKIGYGCTSIRKLLLFGTDRGQIVILKHICEKNEEKQFELKV